MISVTTCIPVKHFIRSPCPVIAAKFLSSPPRWTRPGTPRNGNPLRATFPAPRRNLKSVCKFSAATACITTSPFRIKIYNLYTSSPPPPHIHTYVIEYKFYRPLIIVYSITAATVDKLCGIFLYDALYGKPVTYDNQQTNTAHQIPLTVQSNSNLSYHIAYSNYS